jgi:uncharacterized alkaline shock family protein YloU
MLRTNNIYFTKEIIHSIIKDIVNKVPGVVGDTDQIVISYDKNKKSIVADIKIDESYDNILSISQQVQKIIHYNVRKLFDLNKICVDVVIK